MNSSSATGHCAGVGQELGRPAWRLEKDVLNFIFSNSARAKLWRRTSDTVNRTVSFPTQLDFKVKLLKKLTWPPETEGQDRKCQGFNCLTFLAES